MDIIRLYLANLESSLFEDAFILQKDISEKAKA